MDVSRSNADQQMPDQLTIGSVYTMINEIRDFRRKGDAKAQQMLLLLIEHVLFDLELRETKANGIKNELAEIAYQVRLLVGDVIFSHRTKGESSNG